MMRCAGSQGAAFACMVADMQEPLDAALAGRTDAVGRCCRW